MAWSASIAVERVTGDELTRASIVKDCPTAPPNMCEGKPNIMAIVYDTSGDKVSVVVVLSFSVRPLSPSDLVEDRP